MRRGRRPRRPAAAHQKAAGNGGRPQGSPLRSIHPAPHASALLGSRFACSRRAASLRLGLVCAGCARSSRPRSAPSALLTTAQRFLLSRFAPSATGDNCCDSGQTRVGCGRHWALPIRSAVSRPAPGCSDASDYIIPPMSGMAGAAGAAGAGLSATRASVVSRVAAMEAAFCRAERVTLVGSTMPAAIMST